MSQGDMKNTYQVWHRDGERFQKVADVQADDLFEVVERMQNHESLDDPHEGERWIDQAGIVAADGYQRSTGFGDVIIDPDGSEYEIILTVQRDGRKFGLLATTAIAEQGYVDWLAEQAESYPEPELPPDGQERLFQEWRDDASQRELAGKGVDYSDAPYGESNSESYAAKRAAAIASAKFQRPPEPDVPSL